MKWTHLLFALATGLACDAARPQTPGVQQTGTIRDPAAGEISGIAPSLRQPDAFWAVNDSDNPPVLYLIGLDGVLRETWTVEDVVNDDWEDLGWMRRRGESFLFIADVGDNGANRNFVRIHLIRSEDLSADESPEPLKVHPVYTFVFIYTDGARDCEAVSYDSEKDRFLLVSKRTKPPVVYALPVHPIEKRGLRKAVRIAGLAGFPNPADMENPIQAVLADRAMQPTAMDFSPVLDRAAVLTYGPLLVYSRPVGTADWTAALRTNPEHISLPFMRQSESVCFSEDGKFLIVTTENLPAPIFRVSLQEHP